MEPLPKDSHMAKISFLRPAVSSINSLYIYIYIYIYTVEPVYNGHPRDWTKLAVIHRLPLYTGDCLNPHKRYQRSEMNIKLLESITLSNIMKLVYRL